VVLSKVIAHYTDFASGRGGRKEGEERGAFRSHEIGRRAQ